MTNMKNRLLISFLVLTCLFSLGYVAKEVQAVQTGSSGIVDIMGGGNIGFTNNGGVAIKLTNKTGGNSIKGTIAYIYTASAIDNAFILIPDDQPDIIGVVFGDKDGNVVADGAGLANCIIHLN